MVSTPVTRRDQLREMYICPQFRWLTNGALSFWIESLRQVVGALIFEIGYKVKIGRTNEHDRKFIAETDFRMQL